MTLSQQIRDYVKAAFSGLWVVTHEPEEAEKELATLAQAEAWQLYRWDLAAGIARPGEPGSKPGNPLTPLEALPTLAQQAETTLLLLRHYHRYLANPAVAEALYNAVLRGKQERSFVVILSPVAAIPQELERQFVVIEHPLPDRTQLREVAADTVPDPAAADPSALALAADSARGLTRAEAEGTFALSLVRHGALRSAEVWEMKRSLLRKGGLLELHRGAERFEQLGGLDALKGFCRQALTAASGVQPRGVLLLGVSGTGKSAFAKALGNEVGRPTLTLDVGRLFGSLVGESEAKVRQALATADAMSPAILFIDEVEKALAGGAGGHQGDSGVAARMFGALLSWLNDHTTDVFVVATCNNLSQLPPEFSRAERWDAVFFIDLPTREERAAIWRLWSAHYDGRPCCFEDPAGAYEIGDANWTGAEIKACCRLAKLLGVSLPTAARNVVPVASTAADQVEQLRRWASGRCLSASRPGIYHQDEANLPSAGRARRKVTL